MKILQLLCDFVLFSVMTNTNPRFEENWRRRDLWLCLGRAGRPSDELLDKEAEVTVALVALVVVVVVIVVVAVVVVVLLAAVVVEAAEGVDDVVSELETET